MVTFTEQELERASEWIDETLRRTVEPKVIGRKLVNVDPLCVGDDIFKARVHKVIEMGDAFVSYGYPSEGVKRDRVEIQSGEVNIPVLYKPFVIERQDMQVYQELGNMETISFTSAARALVRQENQMILQGWSKNGTTYQVKGLYQSAALTVADSLDFGTNGNADKAVNKAITAMETSDSVIEAPAYHLVLNPTQMGELRTSKHATSGAKEIQEVLASLNGGKDNGPGQIWWSSLITAGTGMVIPYDPAMEYFRLLNPLEITNELGQDSKAPQTSPVYGNVFETLLIDVIDANSIVKLTGI